MKVFIDILCESLFLFIVSSLGYMALMGVFKYPVATVILVVSSIILTLRKYGYIDKVIDKFNKR